MEVLRSIPELARLQGPLFLAVGVLVGVHLGDRAGRFRGGIGGAFKAIARNLRWPRMVVRKKSPRESGSSEKTRCPVQFRSNWHSAGENKRSGRQQYRDPPGGGRR